MNAVTSLLTTRRNWEVSNIPAFLPEAGFLFQTDARGRPQVGLTSKKSKKKIAEHHPTIVDHYASLTGNKSFILYTGKPLLNVCEGIAHPRMHFTMPWQKRCMLSACAFAGQGMKRKKFSRKVLLKCLPRFTNTAIPVHLKDG